jgi:hypothetical protein
MGWLDALLGRIRSSGVLQPLHGALNFTSGLRSVPNATTGTNDVSVYGIDLGDPGVVTNPTVLDVRHFGVVLDGTTNNDAEVADAVQAALELGAELYWPPGSALTTVSIDDLHSVKNTGPGAIKRGSDLLYWEQPDQDNVNVLYVSASGTGDGASASFPSGIEDAADYLENIHARGEIGRWRVQLAAGLYMRGIASTKLAHFARYLEIRGASQSIPAWVTLTDYDYGECVLAKSGSLLYKCVAPGTSGASEPTSRVANTDGTVIWQYIGGWQDWATGVAVTAGDYRKNDGYVYVADNSATTGATPPTHTSGQDSDGAVDWNFIGNDVEIPTIEGATIFDGSLNPPEWNDGITVQIGDARYYGDNCYRSRTAGVTGATPPTHTNGTASDDTVTWEFVGERDTDVPLFAISLTPSPRVNIIYCKFHNFQNDASDSTGGVQLTGPSEHLIQYVQTANCAMGCYHHAHALAYHENCIHLSDREGIFSTYFVDGTWGGPNPQQSCFFVNCYNAIYQSRESVSHADYCVIDRSRNDGLFLSIMSRARSVGSHFLRNANAIFCIGSSEWSDTPGSECATYLQTADANNFLYLLPGYSRYADGTGNEHGYFDGELRHDYNWTAVTQVASGGDAGVATTIRTLNSLPTKWFIDTTKKLRVHVRGSFSGVAGTKNVGVYLGGDVLASTGTLPAGLAGEFDLEMEIVPSALNTFTYDMRVHAGSTYLFEYGTGIGAALIDDYGQDNAPAVLIKRTLGASGDSVTIHKVETYVSG